MAMMPFAAFALAFSNTAGPPPQRATAISMQILDDAPEQKAVSSSTSGNTIKSKIAQAGFASEKEPMQSRRFHRANDWINVGESVSEVDIVNVLGRWESYEEWDTIGCLEEMNQLFDDKGNLVDGPALERAWARWDAVYQDTAVPKKSAEFRRQQLPTWLRTSKGKLRDPAWGEPRKGDGPQPDACQSPQRRQFCLKQGQVQRYWHEQNVGLLPFTDESMARSIGKTASELNELPINPLACDIVFDALSRSQSGILDKALIDERKAAYKSPADGAFDVDVFEADLATAKATIATSLAIFPGSLNLIQLIVFFQIDGPSLVQAYLDNFLAQVGTNTAIWGSMMSGGGVGGL